ncbi:hypothetical protein LOD99_13309 [Oopsacas minuta]|uniref:Transposase n=1 Tax=Oopsacas minuta TaxID=111878 RepID=A0AAV7KJ39_9METZ|nr:hypothetical protein LOD99_13309 [Oopsacas minuta]
MFIDAYGPVAQIPVPKENDSIRMVCRYVPERNWESLSNTTTAYKNSRNQTFHDNARPHVSKYVREVIEDIGFGTIEHPPYSPDLSSCHFWLFPELENIPDDG